MFRPVLITLHLAVSALCPALAAAQATQPSATSTSIAAPTPPGPPEKGPGAADYPHRSFTREYHGSGDTAYFAFRPADPAPPFAPMVVFLHGWQAVNPMIYGGWIRHLVLRGNIVVFPVYQALGTRPDQYSPNVNAAVRDAVERLSRGPGVKPDLRRVAIVGHSCGGLLTANYAADARRNGLPEPLAVMCVQPGRSGVFPLADLSEIPARTLFLAVAGDLDRVTGDVDARRFLRETTSIPPANKNLILMRSDTHGKPALYAGHAAPLSVDPDFEGARLARGATTRPADEAGIALAGTVRTHPLAAMGVDAMDQRGLWRWFDALMQAAFTGENRDQALGNTAAQRDMGKWSDGTPVKEPVISAE